MQQSQSTAPNWRLYPISDFARHRAVWQALNDECGQPILLDARFVETLLQCFDARASVLALARQGTQIVTAGIFHQRGWGRWQSLQFSQAPLGLWLCRPGAFSEALLADLAKALPGWVSQIALTQLDPLLLPRPPGSARLKPLDYITTASLQVPADYPAYFAGLSRNVRQNSNKAANRLKREGIHARFEVVTAKAALAGAVADYGDIESQSWKQAGGTAVAADNDQGRFYRTLLEAFAGDGAEVWYYYFDEHKVACDLCLRQGAQLVVLKTTFLADWKRYSPAFALHLEGIRHCSEQGLGLMEFYGAAMDWHRKLTPQARTLYHLNWYRSPVLPGLLNLKQQLLGREPA